MVPLIRFIVLFIFFTSGWGPVLPVGTAHGANISGEPSRREMTVFQAFSLGIIEGVTEYLPVSSTGHLLVAQRMMGIGNGGSGSSATGEHSKEAADAYAICIQAGAILAVLWLYFRRFKQMLMGLSGRDEKGLRMVFNILAAFLPAAIMGILFNRFIKATLFGLWPVVAAWVAGGIAILAVERWKLNERRRSPATGLGLDELRGRTALIVGIIQCAAMWPGVSRSLVTIVGGLAVGLSLPASVEFSFLLGLVTLTAATGYDAVKHGEVMLQAYHALPLAVGLFSAFVSAAVSVKWMVAYLNRHGLALFGYYRLGAALVVGALALLGLI